MNLVGLPYDILLQILECCNATSLSNLELLSEIASLHCSIRKLT